MTGDADDRKLVSSYYSIDIQRVLRFISFMNGSGIGRWSAEAINRSIEWFQIIMQICSWNSLVSFCNNLHACPKWIKMESPLSQQGAGALAQFIFLLVPIDIPYLGCLGLIWEKIIWSIWKVFIILLITYNIDVCMITFQNHHFPHTFSNGILC
mgnify:CR=1 FL=1